MEPALPVSCFLPDVAPLGAAPLAVQPLLHRFFCACFRSGLLDRMIGFAGRGEGYGQGIDRQAGGCGRAG